MAIDIEYKTASARETPNQVKVKNLQRRTNMRRMNELIKL